MHQPEKQKGAHGLARRHVIFALCSVFAGRKALGQAASIAPLRLNNVMIAVSDLDRSLAFYRKLFGAPFVQNGVAIFRVGEGPHFFGLVQVRDSAKPEILSYGLTVADFDPRLLLKILAGLGIPDALIVPRDGTPEIFLHDPSGIRVQLQHAAYGHGSGPRGDILPAAPSAGSEPALRLKTVNHVTLTTTDGPKSQDFYQRVFGLPVMTHQGSVVSLRVGGGTDAIVFNAAASTAGQNPVQSGAINHVCFTMENFEPSAVMGTLVAAGLEPIEYGNAAAVRPLTCRVRLRQRANNGGGPTSPLGTAELYFTDPDNIAIQLQDVSYCGGSGWRGQSCP